MVRIQCECGKFLKVGDALVGKKIKCPACGVAQLVRGPADAVMEAIPKAEIVETIAPRRP